MMTQQKKYKLLSRNYKCILWGENVVTLFHISVTYYYHITYKTDNLQFSDINSRYIPCSVIISRNPIEAIMQIPVKSNYWEICRPLPGNLLATIENPLAVIGLKLPTISKLTIEAKGFSGEAKGFSGRG